MYEDLYEQQNEFAGIQLVERLAEVYRAGAAYETAFDYYVKALEEEVKPDILFELLIQPSSQKIRDGY